MRSSTRPNPIGVLVALGLMACTGSAPTQTQGLRTLPPTLSVSATTDVISAAGGAPELEISALLRNETKVGFQVAVGAQCPLYVRLFPDPTGAYSDSLSASMACAPGGPTIALAPGDTAVLTRVLGADTLATFAPGTYGVNVAVTTTAAVIGVWGGAVQLPLTNSP